MNNNVGVTAVRSPLGKRPAMVFLEVEPWEEAFLADRCPKAWTPRFYPDEADRIKSDWIADAELLSVFIYSALDAALVAAGRHLAYRCAERPYA